MHFSFKKANKGFDASSVISKGEENEIKKQIDLTSRVPDYNRLNRIPLELMKRFPIHIDLGIKQVMAFDRSYCLQKKPFR